jgi:single-stranded-DNA-specific exonuclease
MTSTTQLLRRPANLVAASRLRAAGVDPLLSRLYASRGIKDIKDINAGYDKLLPTDSMKNVRATASYLADCLTSQRRVLIVSDYDCDGATACSVLVMAFGAAGMNFGYMVPDRMVHGYGLTPAIVDEAANLAEPPSVIITVDNGISSVAGVARANERGIDVIVTDHHLCPDVLPAAKLIVNPNQPGCDFASKNIAGCGVAWYVARALENELEMRGIDPGYGSAELLSYVALGTVADVVKLDVNNRILVKEGLSYIRGGMCAPGVLALCKVSGKNYRSLTCSDIGFGIGPRINAAGRLSHMAAGIECLTTLDESVAANLAKELHETNEERKEIQKEMVDNALIQAASLVGAEIGSPSSDAHGRRSIVVFHESFHEGVVGVVAGRIKEDRHRPVVVMTKAQDGSIKGSGRSIPGFHLKHALDEINAKHPGVLLKFGGHAMAAGMTIAGDKLAEFRGALEAVCKVSMTPDILTKTLPHDGELSSEYFNMETIFKMSQQVWGQGFEEPVFVNPVQVVDSKIIGKDKSHLRISVIPNGIEQPIDAMLFGQADLANSLCEKMTVAFKPGINTFRGESKLQMLIELMPEDLNPSLSAALRERESILSEAVEATQGTSRDPFAQQPRSNSEPMNNEQTTAKVFVLPTRAQMNDLAAELVSDDVELNVEHVKAKVQRRRMS